MIKQEEYQGLKNGSYFHITNRDNQLSLTYPTDAPNPVLHFAPFDNNSPDQIWMIEQVQQNKYEIVHAYSTLVISANKKGSKLVHGSQSSSQLFFLQKSDPKNNPLEYWIKASKLSDQYLLYDVSLKCQVVNPKASKCKWQLKKIEGNNDLLKSCLVQFAYSGMFLDLPESSIKKGVALIQYPLNSRCNQRWKVKKVRDKGGYMIISVRSKLCLSIKGRKYQVGSQIIQQSPNDNDQGQIWKLDHQGGSLYIISLMMNQRLFLGVKNNSMNQCAKIVTTNDESYAFWRIEGNIDNS